MPCEEVLNIVFSLLEAEQLAACMLVCKQWRDIARDDYFWRLICAKRWPSIGKSPNPPTISYCKLNKTFYTMHRRLIPPPTPRLSFDDLEFFIDIWAEDSSIFSEIVSGQLFRSRIKTLEGRCTMTLPVGSRFSVPRNRTAYASVLVVRKDSNQVASIIDKSQFSYRRGRASQAIAFGYPDFSSNFSAYFVEIRAWISLLLNVEDENNVGIFNVFGMLIDFNRDAKSEQEVLGILNVLEWR